MRLVLFSLLGCAGAPTEPDPTVEVDCSQACADTSDDRGAHLCYTCQCKAAMDGWLPSQDELQCAEGEPIVVYTADSDGSLAPAAVDATQCANPSLLYGTCNGGGRLGQLTRGEVTVKWICRFNHPVAEPNEETLYDDVGVILHNARNGASCWFDDDDGTGIAGRNLPSLDLAASDRANTEAFERFFYPTQGRGCVACHDNDPFLYTPYLASTDWVTGDYVDAGFTRVTLDGRLASNDSLHLVEPDAAACTACHRITSTETCAAWALDALGVDKLPGHQPRVRQAAGTDLWALGTWMPPEGFESEAAWEEAYGLARDTILRCCAQPGVPTADCAWEPLPE